MNINRNSIEKKLIYTLVFITVIFFLCSCIKQKAQKSTEQTLPKIPMETPANGIKCKSPEEIESLKQTTNSSDSDLIKAVLQKNVEAVKKILRQNSDTEVKDNYQSTALLYAVTPLVKEPELSTPGDASRQKSNREKQDDLRKALQEEQRQIEIIRELLAHGANPNQKDIYGETALIKASGFGYEDSRAVKFATLLIQHQANVNAQDERGFSALMNAAQGGNTELVKYLLANGADAKLANCEGMTVLSIVESAKYDAEIRRNLINILQAVK